MIWLTGFTVIVMLFSHYGSVESRSGSSPWENPGKAKSFMGCLDNNIAISSEFSTQEKSDLESIVDTMMPAITSLSSRASPAQYQAMDIALASSLADMLIQSANGNAQLVSVKTTALVQTVTSCFQSIGVVNKKFITEMKDLITVLAEEAASEANEIEIDDQYSFASAGTFGSAFTAGSAITTGSAAAGTQSLGSALGTGSFASAGSSAISNIFDTALVNSGIFQSILAAGLSSQVSYSIITTAVQSALSSIGVSSSLAYSVVGSVQSALTSVGANASAYAFASAFSSAVASVLYSNGFVTTSNAYSLASAFSSAFATSTISVASQFGVQISASSAASSASTSSTSTNSAAGSSGGAAQSFSSAFGTGVLASGGSSAVSGVASLLSSPLGLTSNGAASRIEDLTLDFLQVFGPYGFDSSSFTDSLRNVYAANLNSGLTSSQAQVEALLEVTVALIQIVNSSEIGVVNFGSSSVVSQDVASTFATIFSG